MGLLQVDILRQHESICWNLSCRVCGRKLELAQREEGSTTSAKLWDQGNRIRVNRCPGFVDRYYQKLISLWQKTKVRDNGLPLGRRGMRESVWINGMWT